MTAETSPLAVAPPDVRALFADAGASPHLRLDVFDLAAVAMGLITPWGYWLRANPAMAELFGYPLEEFLGLHADELIHPDDFDRARSERIRLVSRETHETRIELRCLQRSGETIWTHHHVTALSMPDREAAYLLVQIEDISERKAHERDMEAVSEALARSNRDLEEFVVVASHDLRAPLVTVQGLATMLAEEYWDRLDDDGRHLLDRIIANADQMQTLLGELLEISRLGRTEADFSPVDLGDVVHYVEDQQKFTLQRRNAVLSCNLSGVAVTANWTRMTQLFANLIDNALKYTPSDRTPQIEIGSTDAGDHWIITVADNGIGIPEDHQESVFSMFHRLRPGKELNPGGTGIGLALVERIVRLHGGEIWIDPSRVQGTAFCFTLPKLDQDEESTAS